MVSLQELQRWFANCSCTAKDKLMAMEVLVHLQMLALRLVVVDVGACRCGHGRLCLKVYRQVDRCEMHKDM